MPHKFADKHGNEYTIEMTLGSTRFVRSKFNIDLLNEEDWTRLLGSLLDRVTYVWWLVKDQATEYGLDIDKFDASLMGEGLADSVSDAFCEELSVFYADLSQIKLQKLTQAFLSGTRVERQKFATPEFEQLLQRTLSGVQSSTQQVSSE